MSGEGSLRVEGKEPASASHAPPLALAALCSIARCHQIAADPAAPHEAVARAAELAGAHQFASELP